ncbi:ead/Ea22-like family protein [Klebsiella pneumoniae]|uniref:ead/Ea22-like family protein n=1 Tax=Klebsiella pneumoniae TaxID=573 RepID=UPI0030EE8A74|nr:ead/Ea22-like family protein [Klebsiella pneumoniae]
MTTDITELAQSLKAAANKAGADDWQAKKISGDFYVIRKGSYSSQCGYRTYQPIAEIDHKSTRDYVAIASPANILALVEALENSESRLHEVAVACATAEQALEKAQQQTTESENRVRKQNRHICELFDDNTALRQRIAELESRTVKLPDLRQIVSGDRYVWSDGVYNYSQDVKVALAAAGIKMETE